MVRKVVQKVVKTDILVFKTVGATVGKIKRSPTETAKLYTVRKPQKNSQL